MVNVRRAATRAAEGAAGRRARVAEGRRMKEAKSLEAMVAVVCCVRSGNGGRNRLVVSRWGLSSKSIWSVRVEGGCFV